MGIGNRGSRPGIVLVFLAITVWSTAAAQTPAAGADAVAEQALRMVAEQSDCDEEKRTCLWTGNVKIYYQDVTLSCD